jgi:hypothetical protein
MRRLAIGPLSFEIAAPRDAIAWLGPTTRRPRRTRPATTFFYGPSATARERRLIGPRQPKTDPEPL